MVRRGQGLLCLFVLGWSLSTSHVSAAEPLHKQVDRLIAGSDIGLVAETTTDGDFLRRLTLTLLGRIPSATEARSFLDDKSPDKRVQVVDRLLGTPAYIRQMTSAFDVMLSERRGDGEVKTAEWRAYLQKSVEENKPWNVMAAEILGSDAVDAKNRGPAKFLMDRGVEANLMTREVSRMFFGMDLQCAQCHNHPLIDDYLQSDYYGIYAFLNRTYLFKPDKKKPGVLAENPTGEVSFKSVFTGDAGNTRPRLPDEAQIDEPVVKKGEEYKVKPDKKNKNLRPVPKYSRRSQLVRLLRGGQNRAFARNMANRLWALVMGRGLVEPVDLHHSDNPPSHPELLEVLTDRLMAMKYDIRGFVRELVLSRTFARGVDLPADLVARSTRAVARLESVKQQQAKAETLVKATDEQIIAVEAERTKGDETAKPIAEMLKKADAAVVAAKKAADPPAKALAVASGKLAVKQKVSVPLIASAAKVVAAAKLLPADKELAALAARLEGRAKKIAGEVTAMSKDVASKQVVASTTGKALKTAEAAAAKIRGQHAAARKVIAAATTKLGELRRTRRQQQTQVRAAQRRQKTLTALAGLAARQQAAEVSRAELVKAQDALAPVQTEYDKAAARLSTQKTELGVAEVNQQKTTKALTTTQSKLKTLPGVTRSLATAASRAAAALAELGEDKELAGITKTLQNRSSGLGKELAAAQKDLPGQQSAASAATDRASKARQAVEQSTQVVSEISKRRDPLATVTSAAKTRADATAGALKETIAILSKAWSEQFAIGTIGPLSPEQLGWSVLEATGMINRTRGTVVAELDKKSPLKPAELKDAAKVAARKKQVEQTVHDKLKGNISNFVSLFGAGSGQPQSDFFATVDQALFFANGGEVKGMLASGGDLTARLTKMTDDKQLVEELYLSVLTRRPTDDEVKEVAGYLEQRTKEKRNEAIQEVAWALLTSAEFRFSH